MSEEKKMSEQKQKVEIILSETEKSKIFSLVRYISKNTCDSVCPKILDILLNSERGKLKNNLGRSIFHLQAVDRLNSTIGLERLVEAGLLVNTPGLMEILENSKQDAKDLAEEIKEILQL